MNKKLSLAFLVGFLLAPMMVLAEIDIPKTPPIGNFSAADIITATVLNLINIAWLLFGGFAVCMFIYAGFLFLNAKGDMGEVKNARNALVWGMVGVAVGLLAQVLPWVARFILGF